MASDRLTGLSSAFDAMLERNRRELDALAGKSPRNARSDPAPQLAARAAPSQTVTPPTAARSSAQQALDQKLGPGWRVEILDRLRDGEDCIVRARVTSVDRRITRTQYGSASSAANSSPTRAAVGQVAFSFGANSASTHSSATDRDVERAAVDSALMACARLI